MGGYGGAAAARAGGGGGLSRGFSSGFSGSVSPSSSAAAAAAAMAAMAAAASAPGAAASTPAQRMSVLERAAGVLRDTAMEKWEAGRRLDALSVSIVSLTALREAYKLARAAAVAATKAESEASAVVVTATTATKETVTATETVTADVNATAATTTNATAATATATTATATATATATTAGLQKLRRDKERALKTTERIKSSFAAALQRADRAAAAVKGTGTEGGAKLPDGMELAYEAALQLGRSGAVEELMGNLGASLEAYARSQTLLMFLLSEGPAFVTSPSSPPAAAGTGTGTGAGTGTGTGAGAGDTTDETTSEGGNAMGTGTAGAVQMPPGFPARGRVARFSGAISARQTACAMAATPAPAGSRSSSSSSAVSAMRMSSSSSVSTKMATAA